MRIAIPLLAYLVLLWAPGCNQPDRERTDVAVTWDVAPEPARVGTTTVTVTLSDSSGRPLQGADVSLEATMSHPGMQPAISEAAEVSAGRYEGSLHLSMGGDWVVILDARLPDGTRMRQDHPLPGVRSD